MAENLRFGDEEFRLIPPDGKTPHRLIPLSEGAFSLRVFSQSAYEVVRTLDLLGTNALWLTSRDGFDSSGLTLETVHANTADSYVTTTHVHMDSILLASFTRRRDCTHNPTQLFKFETVWHLVQENWDAIQQLSALNSAAPAWTTGSSFLLQPGEVPAMPVEEDSRRMWMEALAIFFDGLRFIPHQKARELRALEQGLHPDQTVPWGEPGLPSALVFRGFHRGTIQAQDARAEIYSTTLLEGRPLL